MRKIERPECPNPSSLAGGNYKHPDNKHALKSASNDKCMYCESKVSHTYHGDIEHILPKSRYGDLEFVWTNLGYVCAKCNGIKRNKYDETTPFLNPYEENPEEYLIAVGPLVKHKTGSERGEITISEEVGIGLNRIELIEKRQHKIKSLEEAIDRCFRTSNQGLKNLALEELKKEGDEDKEYSLCLKFILKSHELLD